MPVNGMDKNIRQVCLPIISLFFFFEALFVYDFYLLPD